MKKISLAKIHTGQEGFTLVELMVSLSLFIIVVLALVDSLYNVNNASRKVQAMRTVMDNLNFSMESISRTIRTGSELVCDEDAVTRNCPLTNANTQHEKLMVHSTLGENAYVSYRYVRDTSTAKGRIEKRKDVILSNGTTVPGDWVSITSPEIDVQKFSFYVNGVDTILAEDLTQPSVIIKMEGVATASADNIAPFAVQTYLSQRAPE